MDGMEWLIVICVGLDAPLPDSDVGSAIDFAEARSMLYRGVTRAHMMVLAVNEFVKGGWLEFLTGVRLQEDQKFNEAQALRDAEEDAKRHAQAWQEQLAAAEQLQAELEGRVEKLLQGETDISGDELSFVKKYLVSALRSHMPAKLGSARSEWQREVCLSELTSRVRTAMSSEASISADEAMLAIEKAVATKLRREVRFDPSGVASAISSTVAEWVAIGDALSTVESEQGLRLGVDRVALQQKVLVTLKGRSLEAG
jgi:hypothetical protein